MIPIEAKSDTRNFIGRLGENETRALKFYVGDTLHQYPDAQFTVLHQRADDPAAYPVAETTIKNGYVVWAIHSEDVAKPGKGVCSVTATRNNKVIKTEKFITVTDDALDGSAEPPEPWQGWADGVLQAAESARISAAESATNVTHYPKVEDGYWTVWDAQNETWVSTGIHAQGEQGEQGIQGEPGIDGVSPLASVTKVGRTATITIIDEAGATEAEVNDGFTPTASVSKVGNTSTITITDENGTTEAEVNDGFTPTASVSKFNDTTTIRITDKNGTTESEVYDGTDGINGISPIASVVKNGKMSTITITDVNGTTTANVLDGEDAFVPSASVSKSGKTATITITDANGTSTASISDGQDGKDGKDGEDGRNGYSPFAGVEKHGHVATVTVIDHRGITEAYLYDGEDGQPGEQGPQGEPGNDGAPGPGVASGGSTGQILVKKSSTDYDTEWTNFPADTVLDVQVGGVSVLSQGVANIPYADSSNAGVMKVGSGLQISSGSVSTNKAASDQIKAGTQQNRPIVPSNQHESAFYGLAKAAGDSTQSASDNPVGTYTDNAKSAIRSMIGAENGDDIIKVQDTQPTEPAAKIWMPETAPTGIQVPTYAEHQALSSALNTLTPAATSSDIGKALIVKTVADGKPTSYEYGEAGGGSVDPSAIAQAVADWCEENIVEDPTVVIDSSLLVEGAAADSKKVGDTFKELSENGYYVSGTGNVYYELIGKMISSGTANPVEQNMSASNDTGCIIINRSDIPDAIRFDDTKYKANILFIKNGYQIANSYTSWKTTSPLSYTIPTVDYDAIGINVRKLSGNYASGELSSALYKVQTNYTGNLATKDYVDSHRSDGLRMIYPDGFSSRIKPDIYYNGRFYCDIDTDSYKIGGTAEAWVATTGNDTTGDGTENNPYLTITKAFTVATTIHVKEGTYEQGTHYSTSCNLSGKNVIGHGTVIFQHDSSGHYVMVSSSAYFENIVFKHGGTVNSTFAAICSGSGQTVCFVRCVFSDSGSNGLSVDGIDAVLVGCVSHSNKLDGFNYHAKTIENVTYIPNVLEIDCKAYNNGTNQSGSDSCNGSTAHDGAKVIRLNGEYYSCYGGVIAEIALAGEEPTISVNYGVLAHNSTGTGTYNASFWASVNTKMYLYDCLCYGSTYDISAINDSLVVSRRLTTGRDVPAVNVGSSATVLQY